MFQSRLTPSVSYPATYLAHFSSCRSSAAVGCQPQPRTSFYGARQRREKHLVDTPLKGQLISKISLHWSKYQMSCAAKWTPRL